MTKTVTLSGTFEAVVDVLVDDERCIPQRATDGSAGFDLVCSREYTIHPGQTVLVDTGVRLHIRTSGVFAMLVARSSLAVKRNLMLANGVGIIDEDYQGPIKAAVRNLALPGETPPVILRPYARIAQLVFLPYIVPDLQRVSDFEFATVRGEGGFGSTGC